jgi:hypothetical protein
MNSDNLFIAIDGDDVGLKLRELIIANDIENASKFSAELLSYFSNICDLISLKEGKIVFCGGDSILAIGNQVLTDEIKKNLPTGPCTVSIGISVSAEKAYLALQLAKARGKSQMVYLHHTEATSYKL